MENGPAINGDNAGIPPNAVSLYGQNDAMDDFPVLKAFQKYIDAEQAKAQKRMTTLCIFFAIIMTVVIGVFVMLLMTISQRNNSLNDQLSEHNKALNEQLIQMMLKDRERQQQPVLVQGNDKQSEAAIKALTDSMAAMQKQMADQQVKMMEQQAKLLEQQAKAAEEKAKAAAAAVAVQQSPSQDNLALQAETAKLKKAHDLLKAEKEKLAKDKEALRQKEKEMHLRRLYPDYYAKQDREKALRDAEQEESPDEKAPAPVAKRPSGITPPRTDSETVRRYQAALEKSKNARPSPVSTTKDDLGLDDDDDLDELLEIKMPEIPEAGANAGTQDGSQGAKGSSAGWSIPLD